MPKSSTFFLTERPECPLSTSQLLARDSIQASCFSFRGHRSNARKYRADFVHCTFSQYGRLHHLKKTRWLSKELPSQSQSFHKSSSSITELRKSILKLLLRVTLTTQSTSTRSKSPMASLARLFRTSNLLFVLCFSSLSFRAIFKVTDTTLGFDFLILLRITEWQHHLLIV